MIVHTLLAECVFPTRHHLPVHAPVYAKSIFCKFIILVHVPCKVWSLDSKRYINIMHQCLDQLALLVYILHIIRCAPLCCTLWESSVLSNIITVHLQTLCHALIKAAELVSALADKVTVAQGDPYLFTVSWYLFLSTFQTVR